MVYIREHLADLVWLKSQFFCSSVQTGVGPTRYVHNTNMKELCCAN